MIKAKFQRRLRLASALTLAGLAVQLVTLSWASPAAFLVFALLGCALTGAGVLLFLVLIARAGRPPEEAAPESTAAAPEG